MWSAHSEARGPLLAQWEIDSILGGGLGNGAGNSVFEEASGQNNHWERA